MKCISPIFSSMRGKIGGAVASRARGAAITLRALAIPANPNTLLQGNARSSLVSLSAYWRDVLTELQQQNWWDAVGEGSGTGKGLFTKVNTPRNYAARFTQDANRFKLGTAVDIDSVGIFADPPPSLNYSGTLGVSFVIDDSANTLVPTISVEDQEAFTVTATPTEPGIMTLYCTAGQRPSRFSRQFPFQLVGVYAWANDTPLAAALPAINLANLGLPTVTGRVMYVKAVFSAPDGGVQTTGEQRITITA